LCQGVEQQDDQQRRNQFSPTLNSYCWYPLRKRTEAAGKLVKNF
jgi:hypothetical protein